MCLHKLAALAYELALPCVICESHFVKFALCIFHQCLILLCAYFVFEINAIDIRKAKNKSVAI